MLVFDERDKLGDAPGIHALIVGVSEYPHLQDEDSPARGLELKSLTSAAASAFKVYEWLLRNQTSLPLPLATCRLLLSPSEGELAANPGMGHVNWQRATRDALDAAAGDWRKDARKHRDGMTFFYVAGHGFQRNRDDTVLLMEDFGQPGAVLLKNAVEFQNIYSGMALARPDDSIARRQLYCIDACRVRPSLFSRFEQLRMLDVFDIPILDVPDDRNAPIIHATVPGDVSYGKPQEQSLFSQALLAYLDGLAGAPYDDASGKTRWHVSVLSLEHAFRHFQQLVQQPEAGQVAMFGGQRNGEEFVLHRLDESPMVNLRLSIDPEEALTCTLVEIVDGQNTPVQSVSGLEEPHPFIKQLRAGIYRISASIKPPDVRFKPYPGEPKMLLPPWYTLTMKVLP